MLLPAFVRVALFTISMVTSELQNGAIVTEFALIQDNETFPIISQDNDVLVKTPYEFNETFLDNESSATVETSSIIDVTMYGLSDGSDNATDMSISNATEIWTETSEAGPFEVENDEGNVTNILTVTSEKGLSDDEQGQGNSTETWTATSEKNLKDGEQGEGNGTDAWTEISEAGGVFESEDEHRMTTVMTMEPGTTENIDVVPTDQEEGQQQPGTDEGQQQPGTNEEGQQQPGTDEGQQQPGTDEGQQQPGTNEEGQQQPGTNEEGQQQPGTDEEGQQQPGTFDSSDDDLGINTIPGEEETEDDRNTGVGFRIRFNIPRVLLPYTPPPVEFFRRLFGPLGSYGVRNWDDSQFTWRGVRIPWPFRPAARWQGHQIPA